jgi:hypothetical protein
MCIARESSDPCGSASIVKATCDTHSHEWACPEGARTYQRAASTDSRCLPFSDPSTGVDVLGAWGLSSIVRLPVGDRCLWVAESVKLADGTDTRNMAFEPDLSLPFGTCPTKSLSPPAPIVTIEGPEDPSLLVQLDGGYEIAGETRAIYRMFQTDVSSPFGLKLLGGGIAHYDEVTKRILVPAASTPFPWGQNLDLGNAVMPSPEGMFGYAWGCTGGDGFVSPCRLARIDAHDDIQLFESPSQWFATTNPVDATTFFSSGTWISTVFPTASGFEHVYIEGFGTTLEGDTASDLTGTWTQRPTLASCDLPSADPHAFCAGPIAHPEIADPTHPGEMPISYSIGSTGTAASGKGSYWPRLVWLSE